MLLGMEYNPMYNSSDFAVRSVMGDMEQTPNELYESYSGEQAPGDGTREDRVRSLPRQGWAGPLASGSHDHGGNDDDDAHDGSKA